MYFEFQNVFKIYKNFFIFIWNFCEFFNINLGRFAPLIFGQIIGSSGKGIK